MDGCVTVVITVYMGRICLCKYVRLMHGALSGMSPIRAVSLSSCQRHLNRTTGPEPDINSLTDECVWVLRINFLNVSRFLFLLHWWHRRIAVLRQGPWAPASSETQLLDKMPKLN